MADIDMSVSGRGYLNIENFNPNQNGVSWEASDDLTASQRQEVQSGNYGQVTSVTVMNTGSIMIQTEYGTLTFTDGPALDEARSTMEDAGRITPKVTAQMDNVDRMYDLMKMLMGVMGQIRMQSFDGMMDSAFAAYNEKMEQAQDMRNAAIFQFAFSLCAAGLQIAGGFHGAKAASGSGTAAVAKSQAVQMGWGGAQSGMNAIGQFGAGLYQAAATEHEAEAQKQEAFFQAQQQLLQDIKEMMSKVIETVDNFTQAQTQTNGRLMG